MQELEKAKTNEKSLMSVEKEYITSIANGMKDIIGNANAYQLLCGYNILSQINNLLSKAGLRHYSNGVDRESVNNAIKFCTIYGLNTDNREVFCIVRNEKRKSGDKEFWVKVVECKPQGRGTLKIVSKFGEDVKKVYPTWIVREGDDFAYTTYKGIDIVPPTWTPKNPTGKILRVVVPIEFNDGFIDYRIAERESIATNIKAQVKQSLIGKADEQARVLTLMKDKTLDQLLADKTLEPYINETYTGLSSEEMIITKLINNAIKRVPINYASAFERELYEKTFDNADVYKKSHNAEEIIAQNQTLIEMQDTDVVEITSDEDGVVAPSQPKTEEKSMEDLFEELDSNE